MNGPAVDWLTSGNKVDYPEAVAFMEARVAAIGEGRQPEAVWLLEHPPLYTAGTSAAADELLVPERFPVHRSGRGGRHTYHGPGQRVAYVMLDLNRRKRDVRRFVQSLEEWLIATLARLGVVGERRHDRIGIWVDTGRHGGPAGDEKKIAAIGVRIRRWVTFHGIALNVDPDLDHFQGIVPCGIANYGVTSLRALNIDATMADVDAALMASFQEIFSSDLLPR